ncbi:MAG TPA: choice-of-anchor tandem repeat GloVer-containing protein, partial [Thermoanaerobaculia bacterium]|nr:choice-of-anchor tandem repeat GloVer-containing protein [Thermoanaerobaculia bacterium]
MSGLSGRLRIAGLAAALSVAVCVNADSFSVLYGFTGIDAIQPQSPLLVDAEGALFGTSPFGGDSSQGSVFRLPSGGGAGSLQVLYSFTNGSDGSQPFAGLTADPDGNLYGVASAGGDSGAG